MPAEKEIPWCIMFLCLGAIACHICVLMGNLACSSALGSVGSSVMGWSNVGVGMAEALHDELDELLSNVTLQLSEAINRTMETMEMVDGMLSMMGGTSATASAAALNRIALVQMDGQVVGDPFSAIMDFVSTALGQLPSFQSGLTALQTMLVNLKPALEQVGVWVETFADKVQATVETFGTTMDRVQKIFDQLMSKMSSDAGQNAEQMQHETFNLFDTDSDGAISEEDLLNCADLYAINALKGEKAKELIEKFDTDGDGSLVYQGGETNEFGLMVEDPSIVGIMATLLRAYAKRMSMIAGNVAAARMRDEVATSVVSYLQLVCSRNITKVGWVSDMLTNATLPMPFSADVMIELAMQKDDPDVLTVADVGEIVIGMMMTINADYTSEAFDLLSTAEHWSSEGYIEEDQADVVEQVSKWMQSGPDAVVEIQKNMVVLEKKMNGNKDKEEVVSSSSSAASLNKNSKHKHKHKEHPGKHNHGSLLQEGEELSSSEEQMLEILELMPEVAARITRQRSKEYQLMRWRDRANKRLQKFDTPAKRILLDNLMHGQAAADGGAADLAEKALSKGVHAKPETLLFAQWLTANATSTADLLQSECMEYTGESSSPLDAFNTQVQGMVKKISQFINIMRKYADPTGIQHIEDLIDEFASLGMHDVFTIVGAKIVDVLSAQADGAIAGAIDGGDNGTDAADNGTDAANSTTAAPVEEGSDNESALVKEWYKNHHKNHHKKHGVHLMEVSAEAGMFAHLKAQHYQAAAKEFDGMHSKKYMIKMHKHKTAHMSQSQRLERARLPLKQWRQKANMTTDHKFEQYQPGGVSGVWEQVGNLLRTMEKILPTSIDLLKFARKEVSAVAANLDSIFGLLGGTGKAIFVTIADLYAEIWGAYFFFVFSLTFGILMYGFWASGWFGGPQPVPKTLDPYEPPKTFLDRCACCCSACCKCCSECHDTQSCFWSFIILFQVIVLLLFIVSIVFCILAGVQMFMGSSCMQLFIITDTKICTESLNQFATFLSTFNVGAGEVPLSMACVHHELLTCDLIHDKMMQAGIMTVAGSFVSVLFSFELIFGIAIIHERARWRRVINEIEMDRLEEEEEKASKAA